MAISLYVAKETRRHEKRVALVPAVVAKLQKLGIEPCVEPGAGLLPRLRPRPGCSSECSHRRWKTFRKCRKAPFCAASSMHSASPKS